MSATEDYPLLTRNAETAVFAIDNGMTPAGEFEEARRAVDEIDRLRVHCAWLEDIARCRGEENERLRAVANSMERITTREWCVVNEDGDGIMFSIPYNDPDARDRAEYWLRTGYRLELREYEHLASLRSLVSKQVVGAGK